MSCLLPGELNKYISMIYPVICFSCSGGDPYNMAFSYKCIYTAFAANSGCLSLRLELLLDSVLAAFSNRGKARLCSVAERALAPPATWALSVTLGTADSQSPLRDTLTV